MRYDYALYNSPLGILKISEENQKIVGVDLLQEAEMIEKIQYHTDLQYKACKQLEEYFEGKRKKFTLPLNYNGTEFQKKVWNELQNIPYGETVSYEDIAIRIGNKKAVRAIGQANTRNPIMIIIPCHRVINKNGTLGGFGCGTNIKEYLLTLEKGNKVSAKC